MSSWTAWLHVNCWTPELLGSRTLENSSWHPLNTSQLLAGPVRVRRKLFPVPRLAEKLKNIEFSVFKLSAKQFPESMVVLNYLHVSNIFNRFFFFLIVFITKMQCPWGRDPALGLLLSRCSLSFRWDSLVCRKYSVLACFWTVRFGLFCFVFCLCLHASSCISLKIK